MAMEENHTTVSSQRCNFSPFSHLKIWIALRIQVFALVVRNKCNVYYIQILCKVIYTHTHIFSSNASQRPACLMTGAYLSTAAFGQCCICLRAEAEDIMHPPSTSFLKDSASCWGWTCEKVLDKIKLVQQRSYVTLNVSWELVMQLWVIFALRWKWWTCTPPAMHCVEARKTIGVWIRHHYL